MRIGLFVLISCMLFLACFPEREQNNSVITLDKAPEDTQTPDASVQETPHETQDAGLPPPVNDAGALEQQPGPVLDAGQETDTPSSNIDAGMPTMENIDAGGSFGCATACAVMTW